MVFNNVYKRKKEFQKILVISMNLLCIGGFQYYFDVLVLWKLQIFDVGLSMKRGVKSKIIIDRFLVMNGCILVWNDRNILELNL